MNKIVSQAGVNSDKSFCGKKPITLGYEDGLGTNAFSQSAMAASRLEAAKCPNVKFVSQIANGSLQTAITQLNSLVAQGAKSLVVLPDFGASEEPAQRKAMQAGVKVVDTELPPGGVKGQDYTAYVDRNHPLWMAPEARWIGKALHGKGNVIIVSGPAGNASAEEDTSGPANVLKKDFPHIKVLDPWVQTVWDVPSAVKAVGAVLAKYPKIDGIITDYGQTTLGALRAFQTAGRLSSLKAIATNSENDVSCEYYQLKKTNPNLQMGTITSTAWLTRVATRKAIAAAEGVSNQEPTAWSVPLYESTNGGGIAPKCDSSAPGGIDFSNDVPPAELAKYGKPTS